MRLKAARREMDARTAELEARRLFSEMALSGITGDEARQVAQAAQQRFERAVKPWVAAPDRQGDDLDLVASWYIMYQPDLLKELGVNFAPLESVSR